MTNTKTYSNTYGAITHTYSKTSLKTMKRVNMHNIKNTHLVVHHSQTSTIQMTKVTSRLNLQQHSSLITQTANGVGMVTQLKA